MPEKEFNWGSVYFCVLPLSGGGGGGGGGVAKNNKIVSVLERHLSV